jgi:hypothetical protein
MITNIILTVLFVAVCYAAYSVIVSVVSHVACKDCPLKKECDKALESGETPPCQRNNHTNLFINGQFPCGL